MASSFRPVLNVTPDLRTSGVAFVLSYSSDCSHLKSPVLPMMGRPCNCRMSERSRAVTQGDATSCVLTCSRARVSTRALPRRDWAMPHANIDVRPINPTIGAVIEGLDLTRSAREKQHHDRLVFHGPALRFDGRLCFLSFATVTNISHEEDNMTDVVLRHELS